MQSKAKVSKATWKWSTNDALAHLLVFISIVLEILYVLEGGQK